MADPSPTPPPKDVVTTRTPTPTEPEPTPVPQAEPPVETISEQPEPTPAENTGDYDKLRVMAVESNISCFLTVNSVLNRTGFIFHLSFRPSSLLHYLVILLGFILESILSPCNDQILPFSMFGQQMLRMQKRMTVKVLHQILKRL